ncbi:MAG TPA: ADP-ribosylation factor-like protein [Myxococcales bacterium]|jgi:signal recognition particle receptor subunit beta
MTLISKANREICAKIVYYGPGLSGKTTSLRRIYESIRPSNRGEMVSLATEGDRTLFFDFLPIKVERVGDATVRLALYTVPGQVFYNATRKLVLQNADGVVFVADSQPDAMDSNLESIDNLRDNLREMGLVPDQVPLVIQYNKRDIAGVLPVADLRQQLNPNGVPDFETVAAKGKGLMEALRAITRTVIRSLKVKGVIAPRPEAKVPAFGDSSGPSLSSLTSQLEAAADTQPASAPVYGEAGANSGLVAALLPVSLANHGELIESAFRAGGNHDAVTRSMAVLRRLLRSMGPPTMSEVELALMAGLTGPDFSRLLRAEQEKAPSRIDTAFTVVMTALVAARMRR